MQSTDSQNSAKLSTQKALLGAAIGGGILLLLFIFAIVQAKNEESVLGWIIAGLLLAWLGLAAYLAVGVMKQAKASQASVERAMANRRIEENALLDDKLSHSFQIVLVQSNVIKEQLAENGPESEGMVQRALDTIDTTASNGMSMIKDAKGDS
ncbi:hypothetical protein [uncultured Rothia sp.]|uniref:hypothetical protein n=1 Tax=uncultured Rothia sp. TaxID=316088 RepID=UPI003216A719